MKRGDKMAKILLIDDDEDFLEILTNILQKAGYELSTLTSGEEVTDEIIRFKPDIVITDILMPGITGGYVYEEIRRETGPDLPVIIASGTTMKIIAPEDKCIGYCPKPIDYPYLLETIKKLLSQSSDASENHST